MYHPSLWTFRGYPCCGSTQRSNSRLSNGCCPVNWSPSSLEHMGINFSNFSHHQSSHSPVAPSLSNGPSEMAKPVSEAASAAVGQHPPSPSNSAHNAAHHPSGQHLYSELFAHYIIYAPDRKTAHVCLRKKRKNLTVHNFSS